MERKKEDNPELVSGFKGRTPTSRSSFESGNKPEERNDFVITDGLQTALNEIRETLIQNNTLYQEQVPLVNHYTSSQVYGQSLLALPSDLRNKFIQALVNRIAYTKFAMDYFENPLQELAGDDLPLGAIGSEIYINPARGRVYDIDDFAGLLAKYESDVKQEFHEINFDVQYPVTIIRKELEKAFVSWGDFESFLMGISTSLYNGAYIDDWKYTKKLISNAYATNAVQMGTFSFANASAPTADELKAFVKKLREVFLNFKSPSSSYNAWKKVGGYGRAIVSWSKPEDVVLFISNKLASELDVEVLASAFNMDKADLMGKVYYVDNFDIYDDEGTKQFDGSNIYALICDKRWFKIRQKDLFMDEFYNASNRSWQQFLNVIKSFNFSLFANAYMLVGAIPTYHITSASFAESAPEVTAEETITLHLNTVPFNATDTVTFSSGTVAKATVEKIDDRTVKVTGVAAGSSTISAKVGTTTIASVSVTVNAAS